jgi:hypothetical protein
MMKVFIFREKTKKYAQFYLALLLAAFGFYQMHVQISDGIGPQMGALAETIIGFIFFRLGFIPLNILFRMMEKNPKHTVLGVDNTRFFGAGAFVFIFLSIFALVFSAPNWMLRTSFFMTLACLDATLASRYRDV